MHFLYQNICKIVVSGNRSYNQEVNLKLSITIISLGPGIFNPNDFFFNLEVFSKGN